MQGKGGCTHAIHGRSRMTIDPCITTMPGRSTSSFQGGGVNGMEATRQVDRSRTGCGIRRTQTSLSAEWQVVKVTFDLAYRRMPLKYDTPCTELERPPLSLVLLRKETIRSSVHTTVVYEYFPTMPGRNDCRLHMHDPSCAVVGI